MVYCKECANPVPYDIGKYRYDPYDLPSINHANNEPLSRAYIDAVHGHIALVLEERAVLVDYADGYRQILHTFERRRADLDRQLAVERRKLSLIRVVPAETLSKIFREVVNLEESRLISLNKLM